MRSKLLLYMLPIFWISCQKAPPIIIEGTPLEITELSFGKGDRIAFIGNSITHGGNFHKYLNLFYATRYPHQPITTFNTGIAGNQTQHVLARLRSDVFVHQPNIATLMLGLNDVGVHLHGKNKNSQSAKRQQQNRFEKYQKEMEALIDSIQNRGIELWLFSPTLFDETAKLDDGNKRQPFKELEKYTVFLERIAKEKGCHFIDFLHPMDSANRQQQLTDSTFTIVGKDRIHPQQSGHFFMQSLILEAQKAPRYIAKVHLDAEKDTVLEAFNCRLTIAEFDTDEIHLAYLPYSLPYPIDTAVSFPNLFPFNDRFNQEILKVEGLEEGVYDFTIANQKIGAFSNEELAQGINLANIHTTPLYKQAQQIADLNNQRHQLEFEQLRLIALYDYGELRRFKEPKDLERIANYFDRKLERNKRKSWYTYKRGEVDNYLKFKPLEEETEKRIKALQEQIYQINQPKKVQMSIIKQGKFLFW